MEQVRLWPANTLPLPFRTFVKEEEKTISIEEEVLIDDNFPKGRVARYFPHLGYGLIKDRVGREIYFNLNEMDFVGPKKKESLKEGILVGYDLVHTGKALHVKNLKIY